VIFFANKTQNCHKLSNRLYLDNLLNILLKIMIAKPLAYFLLFKVECVLAFPAKIVDKKLSDQFCVTFSEKSRMPLIHIVQSISRVLSQPPVPREGSLS